MKLNLFHFTFNWYSRSCGNLYSIFEREHTFFSKLLAHDLISKKMRIVVDFSADKSVQSRSRILAVFQSAPSTGFPIYPDKDWEIEHKAINVSCVIGW